MYSVVYRKMLPLFARATQYDFAVVAQVSSLVFLLGYWVASVVLARVLGARSRRFRAMDIRHRRNVVTYVLQLVSTTIAFVTLTAVLPRIITVTRLQDPFDRTDMWVLPRGLRRTRCGRRRKTPRDEPSW